MPVRLFSLGGSFFATCQPKLWEKLPASSKPNIFSQTRRSRGTLSITPPQNVSTEGVTWKIVATEKCISGSGTNRSTHTHKAYESTQQLAPRGTLPGGVETKFAFEQILPKDPLFSVNLSDNNLEWTGELRVAISIWPDWVKKLRFKVVPPAQSSSWGAREIESNVAAPEVDEPEVAAPKVDEPDEWGIEIEEASLAVAPELVQEKELVQEQADTSGPAITFEETADMIWAVRDDLEQLGRVVDAVREVPLQISARIQRREIFGGRDEFAYDPGVSLRAIALDPTVTSNALRARRAGQGSGAILRRKMARGGANRRLLQPPQPIADTDRVAGFSKQATLHALFPSSFQITAFLCCSRLWLTSQQRGCRLPVAIGSAFFCPFLLFEKKDAKALLNP